MFEHDLLVVVQEKRYGFYFSYFNRTSLPEQTYASKHTIANTRLANIR